MNNPFTVGRLTLLIFAMATAGTSLLGQAQPSPAKPPAYAKDNTALLIVDPFNDFMSEGGKMYKQTLETATAVGFYENMRKLIPAIRTGGVPVVIVPHHRAVKGDFQNWYAVTSSQRGAGAIQLFAEGTRGGEWHPEFGPKPGDVVAKEHWAQSGFANTDLDRRERSNLCARRHDDCGADRRAPAIVLLTGVEVAVG